MSDQKFFEEKGLLWKRFSDYHFQIIGVFLVNYYPSKNTYYVQGSNKKLTYSNLEHLSKVALGEAELNGQAGKRGKRGGSSKKKRQLLWNAGHKRCFVCGGQLESADSSTLEHKVPLAKGGSNRRDNLTLSHHDCNQKRGNAFGIAKLKNQFERLFYGQDASQSTQSISETK